MNELEQVLLGRNGSRSKDEIRFSCPYPSKHKHGDEVPSCYYNTTKRLFHCQVCESSGNHRHLERILGLAVSNQEDPAIINQPPPPRPNGVPDKWPGNFTFKRFWTYHDKDANPIGVVVRFEDAKGKKQIIPFFGGGNGNGQWKAEAPPKPATIYNLHGILSSSADSTIWIVEGEKCADAIIHLYGIATTSQGGCTAAPKSDWSPLADRHVIIWPDADQPGERYCSQVSEILRRLSPRPRVDVIDTRSLRMSQGDDVVDYLCRTPGASHDTLLALPLRKRPGLALSSVSSIASMEFGEIRWAIPNIIPEGLTILSGKPKSGKSWLTLSWANQVTSLAPDNEAFVLALEDSLRRIKYRTTKLGIQNNSRIHITTSSNPMTSANDEQDGLNQMALALDDHPNCRLVIIDTMGKFLPRNNSRRSQDQYQDALEQIGRIQRLAIDRRLAILMIHHMRKGEAAEDHIDDALGSVGITGTCDCIASLRRTSRGSADATLQITGRDVDDQNLSLSFHDGRWTFIGATKDVAVTKSMAEVLRVLDLGPAKFSTLKEQVKLPIGTLKTTLSRMRSEKLIHYLDVTSTYSVIDPPTSAVC
jgi:hypothetical protein